MTLLETLGRKFVALETAPEQLKSLSLVRRALAQIVYEDAKKHGAIGWTCYEAFDSGATLHQAIEDLATAGLIEIGVEKGWLAVRVKATATIGDLQEATEEGPRQ